MLHREVCCHASCKISKVLIFWVPYQGTWGPAEEDPPNLESMGLFQQRRGNKGQYVYLMTMPHPKLETVAAHEL